MSQHSSAAAVESEPGSGSEDRPTRIEKELRLALVCYGGLSLAVYMHGLSKEILKLARASALLAGVASPALKSRLSYDDVNDDPRRETDTERHYFKLLQRLGAAVDIRVVVDVIAGSSAGGINGIMLARSIAHDLPLDAHREMWLGNADVSQLMNPSEMPARWSKPYVRPVLWGLNRAVPGLNAEAREKVSTLVRARWLKPPFSGRPAPN